MGRVSSSRPELAGSTLWAAAVDAGFSKGQGGGVCLSDARWGKNGKPGVFLGADRTQPPAELFGTWYPGKEISAT